MEKSKITKKLKIVYEIDKKDKKRSKSHSEFENSRKKQKNEGKSFEIEEKNEKFPKNFEKMWSLIEIMMDKKEVSEEIMWNSLIWDPNPSVRKFQTLVSMILSSLTRGTVTYAVTKKLIDYGLTVENIIKTPVDELTDLLQGVRFTIRKANYIKDVNINN